MAFAVQDRRSRRRRLTRVERWVLDGMGGVLLATGAVGAVVPGMPTTVFWIGAGAVLPEDPSPRGAPDAARAGGGAGDPLVPALAPFGGGRKRGRG
ncbi:YbaN family protein [Caulobacter vibrioides]|uniref:YbaN family protein n=1 Tax=Caulobacter vibrioides TaxID=155892 RepID=UPI001E3E27B7|nr:YbaN family protein [Caulobacter vibrioides]